MLVVVPMAGRGSRFKNQGVETPKPFIPVNGVPMIIRALESLRGLPVSRIVFIGLEEHREAYQVESLLQGYEGWVTSFVWLKEVTEGQLCTVLEAREYFEPGLDVLISASDTFIKSNIAEDIQKCVDQYSGLISVARMEGDRWSFARTDDLGNVIEVAEKVRISEWASTGLYYFSDSKDLEKYGQGIIEAKERTKEEYYVIPVYQKMIRDGKKFRISVAEKMWDMGTPEAKVEFEHFLKQAK